VLQVCSKPFDSSCIEIDLWVETFDVFLSSFFTDAEASRGRSGSFMRIDYFFFLALADVFCISLRQARVRSVTDTCKHCGKLASLVQC